MVICKIQECFRLGIAVIYFCEGVTLRLNEYGVCSTASCGHPLPREFASRESLLMSVGRMEFVTSQRDTSRVLTLIVSRYSATAAASTRTFPDPAQWRSSPFFLTPETQNDSPVSISM